MKPLIARDLVLALVICTAATAWAGKSTGAAAGNSASIKDVKVTVTLLVKKGTTQPSLTPEDLLVYQNGERRPVIGWQAAGARGAGLDLAILIDDSLVSSVADQWNDLRKFMSQLPPDTRLEVVYGTHGDATIAQPFTADRELAAKALRLPLGSINGASSIFMSLTDLLRHWPADQNRRAVLVVSDGLDLYYGVVDSQAPLDPDLTQAIDKAQKTDTAVYTLFANATGLYRRNLFLRSNGMDCLGLLAESTGGESYFQGFETPVSFAPFLGRLAERLGEQYVLTFRAAAGNAPRFDRLRVTTEQPGVTIRAPERVFVPAS